MSADPLDGLAPEEVDRALAESADHHGLPDYYRSCVRPLLRLPVGGWPRCCGGGCEPCSQTLRAVACTTLARLGRPVVDQRNHG